LCVSFKIPGGQARATNGITVDLVQHVVFQLSALFKTADVLSEFVFALLVGTANAFTPRVSKIVPKYGTYFDI
jgi:hypothetical protein